MHDQTHGGFFGHDSGSRPAPKVFLRALLYSTGKVGRVIEHLYVRLRRGETRQNFNIWVYGEDRLMRGSGLFVGPEGVAANHHFLLPADGTTLEFKGGDYRLEVFARIVGSRDAILLQSVDLTLPVTVAEQLKTEAAGAYFDWGPDSQSYHVDVRGEATPNGVRSAGPRNQS